MTYQRVKKNYQDGLWTKEMVKRCYAVGIITKEQYKEIVALPQSGGEGDG